MFFGSGTYCVYFGGFWGNNSSKQPQIELKCRPQVVLIVAQVPFKAFWKARIFTETGRTKIWVFDPTLTLIYPLKMAKIKNSQWAIQNSCNQDSISFQLSMMIIISFQMGPGSKFKRSELRLAPLFQKSCIKG